MSTPRVIAIVLNYNGKEITLQALASLRQMTYPDFEILHVDNGSSDGSTAAIAEAQLGSGEGRRRPRGRCAVGVDPTRDHVMQQDPPQGGRHTRPEAPPLLPRARSPLH